MSWANLPPATKTIAERELTPLQLDVFRARLDGHSYRTIGLALARDESSIRRTYERALRRMRPHLRQGDAP